MHPSVVRVPPDAAMRSLIRTLLLSDTMTAFVVDEDERVIGVVSAADIVRSLGAAIDGTVHPSWLWAVAERLPDRTVSDVMTMTEPVRTTASIADVAAALLRSGAATMPVADRSGRLVGIITRSVAVASARQPRATEGRGDIISLPTSDR